MLCLQDYSDFRVVGLIGLRACLGLRTAKSAGGLELGVVLNDLRAPAGWAYV